ncbi:3'-5' exonuclease-like [Euphorbia lathyris]|uniref:3'-5' exonuclease-like n=1 Tax=Euphorbia lathyris TaxID=212925 RepID=UPI003313FE9B
MAVSIRDHQIANNTHNLYDVTFYTDQIRTLVTHTPSLVDGWLAEILQNRRRNQVPFIVGLDVEWRPNFFRFMENPIATLQLCIGNRCLIFQIMHSPSIQQSLREFLQDGDFVFVGVGIANDVAKLLKDYRLVVMNTIDLRSLAVQKSLDAAYQNAGLKELTLRVLGREIEKPKSITLSRWDSTMLTPDQVQYACLDAFVSCEIGNALF